MQAPTDDFGDENAVYFRLGAVGHLNYVDYPVNDIDHCDVMIQRSESLQIMKE